MKLIPTQLWRSVIVLSLMPGGLSTAAIAQTNDEICEMLASPNPALRQRGVEAMIGLEQEASSAVHCLLPLLEDPEIVVRNLATTCLGYVQEPTDMVVPALFDALESPVWTVRYNAAFSLRRIGLVAEDRLRDALKSENSWVRLYAADTLRQIGSEHAGEGIPVLIDLAKKVEELELLNLSLIFLGDFGPSANEARWILRERLEHPKAGIRRSVLYAIGEIQPAEAAFQSLALARFRESQDRGERMEAIAALAKLPETDEPTIAALVDALADHSSVADTATKALASMPDLSTEALIEALAHSNSKVRSRAAVLLGQFRTGSPAAIKQMIALLRSDPEVSVRAEAANALALVQGRPEDIFNALEQARKEDPSSLVQKAASIALEKRKSR